MAQTGFQFCFMLSNTADAIAQTFVKFVSDNVRQIYGLLQLLEQCVYLWL